MRTSRRKALQSATKLAYRIELSQSPCQELSLRHRIVRNAHTAEVYCFCLRLPPLDNGDANATSFPLRENEAESWTSPAKYSHMKRSHSATIQYGVVPPYSRSSHPTPKLSRMSPHPKA